VGYENVPESMRKFDQWVCFKLEPGDKDKPKKVPKDPKTGQNAKSNDPSTWSTFAEAVEAVDRYGFDGIGFEFANGFFGVDLDHVVTNGEISNMARDIIETMDSYTEYSPSGTGVHVLCRGNIPQGRRKKGDVEMYSEGRYFTVTGRVFGEQKEVNERSAAAAKVHAKYLQDEPTNQTTFSSIDVRRSPGNVLDLAFQSKQGSRIEALWRGDWSGYSSQSDADLAFCNHLAYWTDGNREEMDRIFRDSGLVRPKWNERHGSKTYGEMTIDKALSTFLPVGAKQHDPQGVSTISGLHKKSQDSYPQENDPQPDSVYKYLEKAFVKDVERFMAYKERKTGFDRLDSHTFGLYPGLYVIGAITSLGKTTFIHQIGDNLAAAGDHVIYFSLEQSRMELVTKSLSRTMAVSMGKEKAISAIRIRAGELGGDRVQKAAEIYSETAKRVNIVESNFNTSIEEIREYVERYIKANGVDPIVIVDYLQIIPPSGLRQTDKERVDSIVRGLKVLQRDYQLVIFVVSSLNRANYMTPVDLESFKETGGIEYTADVVWGLQLSVLNQNEFDKTTTNDTRKRKEILLNAKKQIPREVGLVVPKNRFGLLGFSVEFDYYPQCDLFVEREHKPMGKEV